MLRRFDGGEQNDFKIQRIQYNFVSNNIMYSKVTKNNGN